LGLEGKDDNNLTALRMSKTAVNNLYAITRERISRYAVSSIKSNKLGGPGKEVSIDVLKM